MKTLKLIGLYSLVYLCPVFAGHQWHLVVDGKEVDHSEHNLYGQAILIQPVFSPDGKTLVYVSHEHTSPTTQRTRVVAGGKVAGTFAAVGTPTFSPDGTRLSYYARFASIDGLSNYYDRDSKSGKSTMVTNGKTSKYFDTSISHAPVFSTDSQSLAYWIGNMTDGYAVIVNEQAQRAYDEIHDLAFSPDGRRLAYIVGSGGLMAAIIDGKVGNWYPHVQGPVEFSLDGRRTAYLAHKSQHEIVLVVDGKEGRPYTGLEFERAFGADGRRLPYWGQIDHNWHLIVDDKLGRPYENWSHIRFSPNTERMFYTIEVKGKEQEIIDGVAGPIYDQIGYSIFSPDSRQLAYMASHNGKEFMVVNGKPATAYDRISDPVFSPDGRQLAYRARSGNTRFIVINGEAYDDNRYAQESTSELTPADRLLNYINSKVYDEDDASLAGDSPIFSPDSGTFAYIAKTGYKFRVITNGVPGKAYDRIGGLLFSPDSKKLCYRARLGKQWFLVINGKESKAYDAILSPVFSPDGNRLAFWARKFND